MSQLALLAGLAAAASICLGLALAAMLRQIPRSSGTPETPLWYIRRLDLPAGALLSRRIVRAQCVALTIGSISNTLVWCVALALWNLDTKILLGVSLVTVLGPNLVLLSHYAKGRAFLARHRGAFRAGLMAAGALAGAAAVSGSSTLSGLLDGAISGAVGQAALPAIEVLRIGAASTLGALMGAIGWPAVMLGLRAASILASAANIVVFPIVWPAVRYAVIKPLNQVLAQKHWATPEAPGNPETIAGHNASTDSQNPPVGIKISVAPRGGLDIDLSALAAKRVFVARPESLDEPSVVRKTLPHYTPAELKRRMATPPSSTPPKPARPRVAVPHPAVPPAKTPRLLSRTPPKPSGPSRPAVLHDWDDKPEVDPPDTEDSIEAGPDAPKWAGYDPAHDAEPDSHPA